MSYPMIEHKRFNWGFNVDGKLHLYHPWNVRIKDKLSVKNWTSELKAEYPQPRLMSDEMRKYTVWFFETYQRQREALKNPNKPPLEMFSFSKKTTKEKSRNLTACYLSLPTTYREMKYRYCPLVPVGDQSYSPNNFPPRYNTINYGSYS